MKWGTCLFLPVFALLLLTRPGWALVPQEVAVVYNSQATVANASSGVALYYARARGIPSANIIAVNTVVSENATETQYIDQIATPISNYLSTHPNIRCIVLCYGIPSWMSVPTYNGRQGVDSTLELLGNDGALDPTKLIAVHENPYYNKSADFNTFRVSSANTINVGGGQTWTLNYLVCRLDGYSTPTESVTIDNVEYTIPTSVKGIIDRAVSADAAGTTGLTNAIAVLDDAPYYVTTRQYSSSTESSLNDLLEPITGTETNVWREPGTTSQTNTYAVEKQNVILYSSNGSYDFSADTVTTWWQPRNSWKDGAVGIYWNVSGDGYFLRTPTYFKPWCSGRDTQDVEQGVLKATGFPSGTLYSGYWLELYDSGTHTRLARANFVNGVARIDLSGVTWIGQTTYVEVHFPDDDSRHALESMGHADLGSDLYASRDVGFTYHWCLGQSLASELIRDGCTAVTANVGEPYADYTANPNIVLPRYASSYSWAESAWMGIPRVPWMQVAIGDPLMAPFATPPSVSITEPSATFVSGTIQLAATAESAPNPATGIAKVDFWLQGSTAVLLGTATTSPYTCSLDTTQYSDGTYALAAVAYEDNSQHECAQATKNIVIYNNHQVADARALQTSTLVTIQSIPVIAGNTDAMDGAFYIEEPDRTTGIRVAWTTNTVSADQTVTVTGTIGNNPTTGEREITASNVTTGIAIGALQPVAIGNLNIGGSAPSSESYTNAILGGVGLYNTGLLVRVWGVVTYVGDDFIYVDDGSGLQDGNSLDATGLRVCFGSLDKPGIGDYVSVPGVSSIEMIGSNRVRLVRAIDSCAAYSEGEGLRLMSVRSVENSESDDGRTGGGTFRPWPYPTAEEVLASVWFNDKYSQPGMLGWALSQPDGSVLDLRGEATCGASDGGRIIGLREWYEPAPCRPNLVLCLDGPIRPDIAIGDMATIDIHGGTLVTLSDGRRALMRPEAVYAYTDSRGRLTMPLPWSKTLGLNVTDDEWPWKLRVAP